MPAVQSVSPKAADSQLKVWGASSFDNEAALGWVERLEDAPDLEIVEEVFDEVLDTDASGDVPDPQISAQAIAAAETVAALANAPSKQLPEEVRQWCFDNPSFDLSEVRPKAVQALGVVLQDSELRALFVDSGADDDWESEVEELRDRLRG